MARKPTKKAVKTETVETKSKITKGENYVATKTAKGTKSFTCGDDVAERLAGMDIEDVYGIAADETGVDEQELRDKYSHLNVGMQRMSLGNRIRGAINKRARDEAKAAEKAKAEKDAA